MFVEIAIVEARDTAEALSDALIDAGALSVTIEDADAGGLDEVPLYGEPGEPSFGEPGELSFGEPGELSFGEPGELSSGEPGEPSFGGPDTARVVTWTHSRVLALFDASIDAAAATRSALDALGRSDSPPVERREVADADWVVLTQSQFDPIAIDDRLWIVPSWHDAPAAATAADAIVLRLDPGMAFGTGDHPTTRLCLRWLVANVGGGERVIDYGCGSGILAIAAARLGATDVVGTDIDPHAVTAAATNAADNAVSIDLVPSTRFDGGAADIVVANILSNPLKVLAPLLTSLVRPGGALVLSGVLERQWTDVAAAYAPAIALDVWAVDDGWVCLAGRRPAGAS